MEEPHVLCPNGHATPVGSNFCRWCRAPMAQSGVVPDLGAMPYSGTRPHSDLVSTPQHAPGPRGTRAAETTRLLAAATHQEPWFAEACLREYLVEPYRAIVRVPGVDAAAVLRDAVAADTRRRIRDGLLIVCLGLSLPLTGLLGFLWILVPWALLALLHRRFTRRTTVRSIAHSVVGLAAGLLVLAAPMLGVVGLVTTIYSFLPRSSRVQLDQSIGTGMLVVLAVLSFLPFLLIGVLLVVDELVTLRLLRQGFRRGSFTAEPQAGGLVGALRGLRRRAHDDVVDIAAAAGRESGGPGADVVVFRDGHPFVGAGRAVRHFCKVIPLESDDPDAPGAPVVSVEQLYHRIDEKVHSLRRPSTLVPRDRLVGLRTSHQLLVDADELVAARQVAARDEAGEDAEAILPDLNGRPRSVAPIEAVQHQVMHPREWVRHYRCYELEGWDRELGVTLHVTLGADAGLLYLEWIVSVLPPVADTLRDVDHPRRLVADLLDRALTDLIRFPLSVVARFRRLCGLDRLPIRTYPDELVPDKYGAGRSMRELAAETSEDWFHEADVLRYTGILEEAVLDGVRTHLREQDISLATFEKIAESIVIGSVVNSAVAAGRGATASSTTTSSTAGGSDG